MSHVAAVVVNHRTPVRAAACVASLRAAGVDEVLVVDAGSDDGSVESLRAEGVTVVALRNVGFGRAANAGVSALSGVADAVIVCNADTTWDRGAAAPLAEAVRRPGVAAAGPSVTYPDGRHQASARQIPDLATTLGHGLLGLWLPENRWTRRYRLVGVDSSVERDVDWLSGCAMMLDRAAFTAVGGFDPGYFLYGEDVDLGVRLRAAGGRLVTVPAARVVHEVGASTRARRATNVAHHARSLDRFAATHLLHGPRRLLRGPLRVALAGWALMTLLWERMVGFGRSTTGE